MTDAARQYSPLDHVLIQLNHCLETISSESPAKRQYPAENIAETVVHDRQRQQSASFMRINHCGEVCAQALYHAQALVARDDSIRQTLQHCGSEETDHLAWCRQRLVELHSHRSYLNLLWYWNSFAIGIAAGLAGDRWSLGFVEETEIQVGKHLQRHLDQIHNQDHKSEAVITQMQIDEAKHARTAAEQGANPLPTPVKWLMKAHAKVMTTLAYWI